jgi:hypothetical protein
MTSQQVAAPNLINSEDIPLTVEALRGVMPKNRRHNVTQSLVDEMNQLVSEPEARDAFRDNILSYTNVLSDPNVTITTYIEAVKYVSYQLMGFTNQESWIKTFPHRYARLIRDKKSADFIRSTVAMYNKNKTVNRIKEQTLIPSYVLNQDLYQKAINTQAQLMITAKSEKVRTDAANSLLVHLKIPEATKLKVDVEVVQDDSVRELRAAVTDLALAQKEAIELGVADAGKIAKAKLINGESKRID